MAGQEGSFGLSAGVGGSDEAYSAQQAREDAAQKLSNATIRPQALGILTETDKRIGERTDIPLTGRRIPRSQF